MVGGMTGTGRNRWVRVLEALVLGPLVVVGAFVCGEQAFVRITAPSRTVLPSAGPSEDPARHALDRNAPPGPPRARGHASFALDAANAIPMTGMDDPVNERWADVAGNFYCEDFVRSFSYEPVGTNTPRMFVRVDSPAPTLRGRLELRGMKPNFAYQIKVRGRYEVDPEGFRRIGYAGRWRLPGGGTNFTDRDFETAPNKADVTAYVLFDYVVTDQNGNAARDFAMDSSLHVLWNVNRQDVQPPAREVTPFIVDASDPAVYVRPKATLGIERIWAEPEAARYGRGQKTVRLPEGRYQAEIVLTEESWHTIGNDSGFWATVAGAHVDFTIRRR